MTTLAHQGQDHVNICVGQGFVNVYRSTIYIQTTHCQAMDLVTFVVSNGAAVEISMMLFDIVLQIVFESI